MASNTRTRPGGDARRGERLREEYLLWLSALVQEDGHPRRSYKDLMRVLYQTEFVWNHTVPNDDNRIMDGLDLRLEFLNWSRQREDPRLFGPCSVLEVIVGLSRRLSWLAEGSAEGWAWQLLCNLELQKFRDPLTKRKTEKVDEILYSLIWRTYDPDGMGGFFPLAWPKEDQRHVEIWYQMCAYVEEIHPEYAPHNG